MAATCNIRHIFSPFVEQPCNRSTPVAATVFHLKYGLTRRGRTKETGAMRTRQTAGAFGRGGRLAERRIKRAPFFRRERPLEVIRFMAKMRGDEEITVPSIKSSSSIIFRCSAMNASSVASSSISCIRGSPMGALATCLRISVTSCCSGICDWLESVLVDWAASGPPLWLHKFTPYRAFKLAACGARRGATLHASQSWG
jgi:hypothetical protein